MRSFIVALYGVLFFLTTSAFASIHVGGGGMDSGGTDGVFYKLKLSRELALEALTKVQEQDLTDADPLIAKFYSLHRTELIIEAATSLVEIKPASDVGLSVDGKFIPKKMVTGLSKGAPVFVADTIEVRDLREMTAFLLHEYGHHLGVAQSEDEFLDRLAFAIVEKAVELSTDFREKTAACLSSKTVFKALKGTWSGETFFNGDPATQMQMSFDENGHYTVESKCGEDPSCWPPLYYGRSGDHPGMIIEIDNACGEVMIGYLTIVFDIGTTLKVPLRITKFSAGEVDFSFQHPKAVFPVQVHLRRLN